MLPRLQSSVFRCAFPGPASAPELLLKERPMSALRWSCRRTDGRKEIRHASIATPDIQQRLESEARTRLRPRDSAVARLRRDNEIRPSGPRPAPEKTGHAR